MKPPAHPPGPTRSLASRLARPLVAAVVLVWSISTALVAWYVDTQIQHNFDTELVESAHRQLYPALLDAATPTPEPTQAQAVRILGEVPGSDYTEPLSLQLRNAQGRLLLRSRAAPEQAFAAPLQEGFYDTAQHRIYTLEEPESGVWLQLADPLEERNEASERFSVAIVLFKCLMLGRHPFDVVEGEAEIVAGHMVEYSGMGFAVFFLAEYAAMWLVSILAAIMFLGGWLPPVDALSFIPGWIWLGLKTAAVVSMFIWIRATFPRYRYDQIMRLGWKIFIPVTLVWLVVVGAWLHSPWNIWK